MTTNPQADPTRRFMHLYAANQRRIYGFIRALVHDPADTDDLVQQTLSAMWDKFADFDPDAGAAPGSAPRSAADAFAAWAMAIARIEVLRFMRSRRSHLTVFGPGLTEQLADAVTDAAGREDVRLDALRRCMSRLPERQRELIELRYHADTPVDRIARDLDRPAPTVYRILTQARTALLHCIRRTVREGA